MAVSDDKSVKSGGAKPFHNIIMENREKISIAGVEEVESFDELTMVISTQMGVLTIKGGDLHINKFNVDTGELVIEGDIDELFYQDDGYKGKGGFFSKMFG